MELVRSKIALRENILHFSLKVKIIIKKFQNYIIFKKQKKTEFKNLLIQCYLNTFQYDNILPSSFQINYKLMAEEIRKNQNVLTDFLFNIIHIENLIKIFKNKDKKCFQEAIITNKIEKRYPLLYNVYQKCKIDDK